MKPGKLIQFTGDQDLSFLPADGAGKKIIRNGLWAEEYYLVSPGNVLMFIETLEYCIDTTTINTDYTVARSNVISSDRHTRKKALKEFEATGKIPGGIFLTPSAQKVWISQHDQRATFK